LVTHSQRFRCATLVTIVGGKSLSNLSSLNELHCACGRFSQRPGGIEAECLWIARFITSETEIARLKSHRVGQNAGTFERVLKFAHMSRPTMRAQRRHAGVA